MQDHHVNLAKVALDTAAVSITAASLMQWLPPTAAALSIVWLTIQIVDYVFVKRRIPQCLLNWLRK